MPPTATPTNPLVPPTATLVACTAGTVTDTAHADAWIDQASANNNVGADSLLKHVYGAKKNGKPLTQAR